MHFVFATRGAKNVRDLFVEHANTQYFPWKRKNLNVCRCGAPKKDHIEGFFCKNFQEREELFRVQGVMRPIELWEYVFPEEHLAEVLTMFGIPEKNPRIHMRAMPIIEKIGVKPLQLAMGLKPVPEYKQVPTDKFIYKECFSIYPIGIKEDVKHKWVEQGYEQEML